jgi:hypothetical protein
MRGTLDPRFRLLHGPYRTPRCCVGGRLYCERLRCQVPVGGIHEAPIPWPVAGVKGPRALILCGDLVQAVRLESVVAVCYWWRVHRNTVSRWRHLLGVGPMTEGTARPHGVASAARIANGLLEKRTAGCRTPEERERRRQRYAALPVKPDEYVTRRWTPAEDRLLGTLADDERAARKLRRTVEAVKRRRRTLRSRSSSGYPTTDL